MIKVLEFLQGKKWTIAAIIWVVVTFLLTQWYISNEVAYLIGTLNAIIFGTASYATYKYLPTTPTV